MKTTSTLLVTAALTLGAPAFAEDYSRGGYERGHSKVSSHRAQPLKLRINYDAYGSGTIQLKRLLRHQYDLDTDDWKIRSVNVRSSGGYDACADLRIGHYSTGAVPLRRGVTTIGAPGYDHDGHWKLEFGDAHIQDLSVILEPRHGYSRRDSHSGGKSYGRSLDSEYRAFSRGNIERTRVSRRYSDSPRSRRDNGYAGISLGWVNRF